MVIPTYYRENHTFVMVVVTVKYQRGYGKAMF